MKSVKIKIDKENREQLKRLHSATHIINFCSKKILGNHVWQNGSNLKPNIGTLDITHYENLTLKEIFKIEELANQIIFKNKKIYIEELDRTKAEKKYGFTLYQGGAIPMKTLRVVKIQDSDIEACGGLHMGKTGGIGLIKIIDTQKIQDGVVRLKFVVHNYAIKSIEEKQKTIEEIKSIFSVDEKSLPNTSKKFFNEWKEQKKEIDNLKKELKQSYLKQINESKINKFELKGNFDMGFLLEIFNQALSKNKSFELISNKFIIATHDVKVKQQFKKSIDKKRFIIYII